MRRTLMLLSAMMMTVFLAAGVAVAADIINCSQDPCVGTRGDDYIVGTINPETINALAGNDTVEGGGGSDTIYLGRGGDSVDAYQGNDTIYGGGGNDGFGSLPLAGAENSDTVYGGQGDDIIDAALYDGPSESLQTPPVDHSYGGSGNDTIRALDGNVDFIDCGAGRKDTAYYDEGIDTVTNCEIENPPATEPPPV